jgi:beta-lactamase class A
MVDTLLQFMRLMRRQWKRSVVYGVSGIIILLVLVQLFYPHDKLLPNTRIDGVSVGGWQKADAAWELDHRYQAKRLQIYFGSNPTPYRSPMASQVGIDVENQERIGKISYPWWLRVVPTSIFWGHTIAKTPSAKHGLDRPMLDAYIRKELGQSCNVMPKNASLKYEDNKLHVIKSEPGGSCDPASINTALETTRLLLANDAVIRIPMKEITPAVPSQSAERFANSITERTGQGVSVKSGNVEVIIPVEQLMNWMDFNIIDGTLTFSLNNDRASDFMLKNIAPKVLVPAGVSKVTTMDFIETARQDGSGGQLLHIENTLTTIAAYIRAERDTAVAMTSSTEPRIEYTRNYSPTDAGLSALLANFAKDHPGTFGISYIELSGKHRRATHDENKTFVTASTFKLFVAFSTLKRIDNGTWSLNDANISDGRTLEKCLDDMIVRSDNACAEVLLKKVGYRTITDEMKALGLKSTSFLSGDSPVSTAADEALFMAQLESKQLPLSPESHGRFIDMLKRNIYRRGIPAGASGAVANKVGFMSSLLHDASIVYSPSGTYVLVIMSDGSSWGALADLTRQLEALRSS